MKAQHAIASSRIRGVYKLRGHVLGRNAYYALTAAGAIIGDCLFFASEKEPDAHLVTRLFRILDRVDPARPALRLLPRTVTGSIDGPSFSHPEFDAAVMLAPHPQPRIVDFPVPSQGMSGTTKQVFESLYRLLYQDQSA